MRKDSKSLLIFWKAIRSSARDVRRFGILGALLAVVCFLGVVQYRWITQLAQAHRQAVETNFARAFSSFERDFDIEITRAFTTFQFGMGPDYAERYREWLRHAPYPELIRGVYVLERNHQAALIKPIVPDEPLVVPGSWMEGLSDRAVPRFDSNLTIDGNPAFFIPAVVGRGFPPRSPLSPPDRSDDHSLLVVLNAGYLEGTFLPRLIRTHFSTNAEPEYDIAVMNVTGGTVRQLVFSSQSAPQQSEFLNSGEGSTFFELRPDCFAPGLGGLPGRSSSVSMSRDLLADILARATSACRFAVSDLEGAPGGRWKMLIHYRAGSLDRVVADFRNRNLVISAVVLLVLMLGIFMLVASAERTRSLAAIRTELVLGVSHELRTPLTIIRVAADNLTNGLAQNEADARKYGQIIIAKTSELSVMIEETLAFARLESMPFISQAALTELAPQDVVRGALARLEPALREASIVLERHITSESLVVRVAPQLLERCVENLVQNAIKYAASGGWIAIHVDRSKRPEAEFARIAIEDRGPGISPEDFPHIFEPFYRGKAARSPQVSGVGLGLGLVKRIVECHGGYTEVANSPAGGAIVSMFLPLQIQE